MEAATAALKLAEVALPERVGERAASRLVELRGLFGGDLAYVEAELTKVCADGLRPATQAATHLLGAGGKRIRPLCVLLSAACFGSIGPRARELALVAEIVHLATLLHDDVVDDSDLRRGAVAARRVWGNAVSVLAGDLLLTHALERTAYVAPGATMTDLLATLRKLVDGEVIQLRGRTGADPSEATYFAIVEGKTASLFSWAARAGALAGGASDRDTKTLGELGRHLGIAFQLVDDALDYAGDSARTGKRLLSDLREGKLTLPLLLAIEARPRLGELVDRARAGDEAAASDLHAAVVETRGSAQTRARAAAHSKSALEALATLPPSPARDLFAALTTELTTRGE
jgi:octaprenyl-diphosphate synthase